jgi:hypothetical protein
VAVSNSEETTREARSRCVLCGEMIGVYEPTVYELGAYVKRSSLAAEPWLEHAEGGTVFHSECFDARPAAA